MKYEMIKKHKISHKMIAKAFDYKTIEAFRTSTAHQRVMNGINSILEMAEMNSK